MDLSRLHGEQAIGRDHSYFWPALVPSTRNTLITQSLEAIRDSGRTFHGVIVRGVSGAAFGGMLAFALDLPLLVLRKWDMSDGGTHSCRRFEGIPYGDLLWVDDFIQAGDTAAAVERDLDYWRKNGLSYDCPSAQVRVTGVLLYAGFAPKEERLDTLYNIFGRSTWVHSLVQDVKHADDWAIPLQQNPEVSNLEPSFA